MLHALQHLLRRPSAPRATAERRQRGTGAKNAQFVSFLAANAFGRVNPDRYERSMRRRKFAGVALAGMLGTLLAWVAIESARALSMF